MTPPTAPTTDSAPATGPAHHGKGKSAGRSRTNPLARLLEAACWIVGVLCLGWVGWVHLDQALYQHIQRSRLEAAALAPGQEIEAENPTAGMEDEIASEPGLQESEVRNLPPVEEGDPLATIEIPRIDVSAVVAEGTTETVLRRAVGHVRRTSRPGMAGNIALAAHRDSFFRSLVDVEVGDEVLLDGPGFQDRYRVEWTRIVEPEDVEVIAPTDYPAVTLVTCYPPWWTGPAPQRLIVRARRLDGSELAGAEAPAPAAGLPAAEGSSGVSATPDAGSPANGAG